MIEFLVFLLSGRMMGQNSFGDPSFARPLLPALFCLPSRLPAAPASYQPLPMHAQRSMFVNRGAAEYVSQKEGAQHQNKNHFDLI